jgi:hypothetical protein
MCRLFYYLVNVEAKPPFTPHEGTLAVPGTLLRQVTPQQLRDERTRWPRIQNGGWHFADLGGSARIVHKIESFTHAELDTPWIKSNVSTKVAQLSDLYDRPDFEFRVVLVDETFPEYLRQNSARFAPLFRPDPLVSRRLRRLLLDWPAAP